MQLSEFPESILSDVQLSLVPFAILKALSQSNEQNGLKASELKTLVESILDYRANNEQVPKQKLALAILYRRLEDLGGKTNAKTQTVSPKLIETSSVKEGFHRNISTYKITDEGRAVLTQFQKTLQSILEAKKE